MKRRQVDVMRPAAQWCRCSGQVREEEPVNGFWMRADAGLEVC